jgi:DnaJ domain
MVQFIAGLLALYLLLAGIRQFGRITPTSAAKIVRGGGFALGLVALLLLLLRGSFGLVGLLASFLFAGAVRGGRNPFASFLNAAGWGAKSSKVSTARSASIEMQLDRDTGLMSGGAIAGPFAGRALEGLTRPECLDLYRYCRTDDPEGAALLEVYLDRRFAGWRQAQQGEANPGGSWSGGAMSRDEAYEILGLPKGAGREEIIAAHRALMKKLHPDHGGSTVLAARVNQAKDVLLD